MIWMDVDAALSEVPVNAVALIDDTDFKTREESVVYNQAGLDLVWNFVTPAGAYTQTAVTPTTGGVYDWTNQGNGMYSIEIPASGGGSINNDTEGFGWFTGYATGILPWTGPVIGFRAAALNNLLIEDAYSATRGLAGTALPNAAADAAGGLPISDAGGLDIDTLLGYLTGNVALASVATEARLAELDAANIPADVDTLLTRLTAARAGYLDNLNGHTAQTGDNYARIGAPAGVSVSADIAAVKTDTGNLVTRITATLFSGITSLAEWLGLIAGKQTGDATARTEIRATGAGSGTYDETTDSQEAVRDRGDAAWVTGGGGAIGQIINTHFLIPTSIDLANTVSVRLGLMVVNSVDDLPSTAEINPGTISIDRKAIGGTTWSSVVSDAACSEAAGLVYYDEVFDAGSGYAEGDSLRVTFKSQSVTADANDYEITGSGGVAFQTEIRQTMRGTDNIGGIGGVLNEVAEAFVLTTGSVVSGSYTDTHADDGTRHQIADAAGTLECYYTIDIGATGNASSVTIAGANTGAGDDLVVRAYNWSTTSWETIRSYDGTALSTNSTRSAILLSKYVGTGGNAGKVRIGFYGTGLTTANLYVDQLYVTYAVIQSPTGYQGGAVWINTVSGTAGTVLDYNGVADRPSNSIADANTIASGKNFNRFYVLAGSSITFAASQQNQQFEGCSWTLALASQDISGSRFSCAAVSGIGAGSTGVIFDDCYFAAVTMPPGRFTRCGIGDASGTFTAASAGEYVFIDPYSLVPGAGTPNLTFSGLGAATGINIRGHRGGANITLDSDCTLSLEVAQGGHQTITTGGADVEIRGIIRELTLVLSGAGTVRFVGIVGKVNISGTATTTVDIFGVASELNDTSVNTTVNYDPVSADTVNEILADVTGINGDAMRGTDNALLAADAPANFGALGIESDGDLTKVNALDGHTPQTGDSYPTVNTNLDATVSSRSSHSAADVWTSATRTLTSFGTLVSDIWAAVSRTLTGTKNTFDDLQDISSADVNAACDTALADYDGPTRAEATSDKDEILTDIGNLNNISVADILTTQMTEAYAADGVAPTLAQALFLLQQSIGEFTVTGTTISVKKIDGTTQAATYTMDSATDPTQRLRAS